MTDHSNESTIRTDNLNYPKKLRLTLSDADSMFDEALETASSIENTEGVQPVATRAFQDIADLRALLTDRRLEVLQEIYQSPPDSISALAEQLDRSYSVVHEDVEVLAEHDIVHFRNGPRGAKQPYIPYETIQVDIPLIGAPITASSIRPESYSGKDGTGTEHNEEKHHWTNNAVDPRSESHS